MSVAAGVESQPQSENPLTAGLERLPVAPTTLVIFGATGDLAKRKLLPALYNLAHDGALPERFHLIGVSRKEITFTGSGSESDNAAILGAVRATGRKGHVLATAIERAVRLSRPAIDQRNRWTR